MKDKENSDERDKSPSNLTIVEGEGEDKKPEDWQISGKDLNDFIENFRQNVLLTSDDEVRVGVSLQVATESFFNSYLSLH